MGDGRDIAARAQPQSEGLDFGSAGFDLGIGNGFALSQGLDAACCPKIPDTDAGKVSASDSPGSAATVVPVQIQVATLDEVKAAVLVNESRETLLASTGEQVSVPITPHKAEIASLTAVAEAGTIDYSSAGFSLGGTAGAGIAAGLGFSLSESPGRDCCSDPAGATTAAGTDRVEKRAIQILEKSIDEVRATAIANDSRDVSPLQPASLDAGAVAVQASDVRAAASQNPPQATNAESSPSAIAIRTVTSLENAEGKVVANSRARQVPETSTVEMPQVLEKQVREVDLAGRTVIGAERQPRSLSTIPSAEETSVNQGKAGNHASNFNEVQSQKKQQAFEGGFEQVSRVERYPAPGNSLAREHPAAWQPERGIGDSSAQRSHGNAQTDSALFQMERRAEPGRREAVGQVGKGNGEPGGVFSDGVPKGGIRTVAGNGWENRIGTVRRESLSIASPGETAAVRAKEYAPMSHLISRPAPERLREGVANSPRFVRGEREREKTMVVRLSNVDAKESARDRPLESKGILPGVRAHLLVIKERVHERVSQIVGVVADFPGVRNLAPMVQRMSELLQRVPIPERLQNFLKILRGRVEVEPDSVMRFDRRVVDQMTHHKLSFAEKVSQFFRQRVVETVSAQLQRISNLAGVKHLVLLARRSTHFVARFQRLDRVEGRGRSDEGAQINNAGNKTITSSVKSLGVRIKNYLGRIAARKTGESEVGPEKKLSTRGSGSQNQRKSVYRTRREIGHSREGRTGPSVATKNHIARNLSTAVSLRRGGVRRAEKREAGSASEPTKIEGVMRKSAREMREIPLKKLNSAGYLKRQVKSGNLPLLNRFRRRGIRGARKLKNYLDPRSLLYRRLMRELSLDELETFLRAMSAQKAAGLHREIRLEPRRKKRQNSAYAP